MPEDHRTMVSVSNPETSTDLVDLGSVLARHHGGTLVVVHVVQVPDQTSLSRAAEDVDVVDPVARDLLEDAETAAERHGVDVESHTLYSHRGMEAVFDAAERYDVDVAVVGWGGEDRLGGRVEGAVDEVVGGLPCDFVVYDDRGGGFDRVLVAVGGGEDVEPGADVARALRDVEGAELRLLHVVDSPEREESGRGFLESWAENQGLGDAELVVDVSGDLEEAIGVHSGGCGVVVVGAVGEGLLRRLVQGSLVLDVLYDLDASVVLTEKERPRGLWSRLFGGR